MVASSCQAARREEEENVFHPGCSPKKLLKPSGMPSVARAKTPHEWWQSCDNPLDSGPTCRSLVVASQIASIIKLQHLSLCQIMFFIKLSENSSKLETRDVFSDQSALCCVSKGAATVLIPLTSHCSTCGSSYLSPSKNVELIEWHQFKEEEEEEENSIKDCVSFAATNRRNEARVPGILHTNCCLMYQLDVQLNPPQRQITLPPPFKHNGLFCSCYYEPGSPSSPFSCHAAASHTLSVKCLEATSETPPLLTDLRAAAVNTTPRWYSQMTSLRFGRAAAAPRPSGCPSQNVICLLQKGHIQTRAIRI